MNLPELSSTVWAALIGGGFLTAVNISQTSLQFRRDRARRAEDIEQDRRKSDLAARQDRERRLNEFDRQREQSLLDRRTTAVLEGEYALRRACHAIEECCSTFLKIDDEAEAQRRRQDVKEIFLAADVTTHSSTLSLLFGAESSVTNLFVEALGDLSRYEWAAQAFLGARAAHAIAIQALDASVRRDGSIDRRADPQSSLTGEKVETASATLKESESACHVSRVRFLEAAHQRLFASAAREQSNVEPSPVL